MKVSGIFEGYGRAEGPRNPNHHWRRCLDIWHYAVECQFCCLYNIQCQYLLQWSPGFSRCIPLHIFPSFVLRSRDIVLSLFPSRWFVALRQFSLCSFFELLRVPPLIFCCVMTIFGSTSPIDGRLRIPEEPPLSLPSLVLNVHKIYPVNRLYFISRLVICTLKDALLLISRLKSFNDFDSRVTIGPGLVYSSICHSAFCADSTTIRIVLH